MNRRTLLTGAAGVAAVGATAASCTSESIGDNTGQGVNQDAGSVNDLVVQQGELSYTVWNQMKADKSQAYPVDLLHSSVELHQQRERLLRFNEKSKTGWAYLIGPQGQVIMEVPVLGKISSTQSSMTTSVGVYSGSSSSGNVTVELNGDDGSFGPNEGGPMGKFFFTPEGVYIYWDGLMIYADARLDQVVSTTVLNLPGTAKPSSVAPSSILFHD